MIDDRAGPLGESVGFWVQRLHDAMHKSFTARLAGLGVKPVEWAILVRCSLGVDTPATLAEHLDVDRAGISRWLDQIELKGLIRRDPHPTDRRSTVVSLTPTGAAMLPRLVEQSRAVNAEFLRHLGDEDRSTLRDLLARVVAEIPRHPPPPDP